MRIANSFAKLGGWLEGFTVEVFAPILRSEWIEEALKQTGREGQRDRKLTAPFTLWLIVAMAMYRHLSIQNVVSRLGTVLGVGSVWADQGEPTSGSVVEARDRLGFGPLQQIVERFRGWILQTYQQAMSWKGLTLLAIDGTTFKVPDSEENRRRFGLPSASRGRAAFPQMRAVFVMSARLHLILGAAFAPYRRDENQLAMRLLGTVPKGALVLLDRHFNGWQVLLGIRYSGSHFLIRATDRKLRGRLLAVLGSGDSLIEIALPPALRRRFADLPKTVLLREITARIKGKPYRFLTSLLEPSTYPAAELVKLYHQRWEEEIALDEIKTHQCAATTVNRPVIFRCQTTRRVLQEAYGLVVAYNLVRVLMADAADQAGVEAVRISFVDSLERIRSAALLMAAAPTDALPRIFNDLMIQVGHRLLPDRRPRDNPREVCVKMSKYPLKRKLA